MTFNCILNPKYCLPVLNFWIDINLPVSAKFWAWILPASSNGICCMSKTSSQDRKSDKYITEKKLHSEIQKVCQSMSGKDLRKQIKESRIMLQHKLSEKWKNSKSSKKYFCYLSRCSIHENNNSWATYWVHTLRNPELTGFRLDLCHGK